MLILFVTLILAMSTTAFAAKAGWVKSGSKISYNVKTSSGLVKATGLKKIGSKYFYFNKSGVLQTGWVRTEEGIRYFKKSGKTGTIGMMYIGFKKLNGRYYLFKDNGVVTIGFKKLKNQTYFFSTSKELGVRGRSIKDKWATYNGDRYYFGSNCFMQKSKWINGKYYVGSDGKLLKSTFTPDGKYVGSGGALASKSGWVKVGGKYYYYDHTAQKKAVSKFITAGGVTKYVNASGERVTGWATIGKAKYYFESDGKMVTGLQVIGGKEYYFTSDGKLAVSTTVDGYKTDADGVVIQKPADGTGKKKILVVSGHGQGDAGACSELGQEYKKTREFAKLVYQKLEASGKVDVTFYENGSESYDLYQQNVKTFGASGMNISSKITGKGSATIRKKLLTGFSQNPHILDLSQYDYILEVHFNATAYSSKDPKGDGRYKGTGFYINSNKKSYPVETKILQNIRAVNSKWVIWAGVVASSTLFNARICQELGVSYGLLETAFIDDKDDMSFYAKHKNEMAAAVANGILSYYG